MAVKTEENLGIIVRELFTVVGYWNKWLVAENEKGDLYVSEESEPVRDVGTVCDFEAIFIPVNFLPPDEYACFCQEFLAGV